MAAHRWLYEAMRAEILPREALAAEVAAMVRPGHDGFRRRLPAPNPSAPGWLSHSEEGRACAMCQRVQCERCGKPTYKGCGAHEDQVLRDVPPHQRCQCPRPAKKSWRDRLLGR
jgi:hypothetical protein